MNVTICQETDTICTEHETYQYVKLVAEFEKEIEGHLPIRFEVVEGETGLDIQTTRYTALPDALKRYDEICKRFQ